MTAQRFALLAAAGSALLLLGAFGFQYLGGMAPCKLCLWQRWPHGAAIVLGLLALKWPNRWLYALGAVTVLAGAAVALYHTGVEQHWWQGPTTCSAQSIAGLSAKELLDQIMKAPLVRCDDIAWSLFGLSMAAWNGVISLGLAGLWAKAFHKG